jgi:hypothetical protein
LRILPYSGLVYIVVVLGRARHKNDGAMRNAVAGARSCARSIESKPPSRRACKAENAG